MLTEFNHQGSVAEKTILQTLNLGVCMDVLKPTTEVREGNKKTNMLLSNYHPCLTFLVLFVSRQKVHKILKLFYTICLIIYSTCTIAQTSNPQQYKYVFTVA